MICSVENQIKIYNRLKLIRPRNKETVVEILQSFVPNYTIEQAVREFDKVPKEYLLNVLKAVGYNPKTDSQVIKEDKKVNNINTIFTSSFIPNLFETLHVAESYFEQQAKELITIATKIGYGDKYVSSNVELNNNIKILKNDLFEKIVRFLRNRGVKLDYDKYFKDDIFLESAKLYSGNVFNNYDLYKEVLKTLEHYLLGDNNQKAILSSRGAYIPNIKGDIRKALDRQVFDAYNAAIILSNFDNIMEKYFGNSISLDYSAYNNFVDPTNNSFKGKYQIKESGEKVPYWLQDSHAQENVETIEDELSSNIINIIKHINKQGEETGIYLSTNDFYSLGSYIREFEKENLITILNNKSNGLERYKDWEPLENNPVKMLGWYLENIIEAYNQDFKYDLNAALGKHFLHRVDIVKSINNFLTSVKTKEENSGFYLTRILGHKLINTYGANYSVYNINNHKLISQEMHSHNSNKVDLNNTTYRHLLNNVSQPNKFWIKVSPKENMTDRELNTLLKEELESIKEIISTDSGLSDIIFKSLGIFIGKHGAAQLRNKLGEKTATTIQDILSEIRSKKAIDDESIPRSILDRIIENEKNIDDENYGEVLIPSDVISPLVRKIQDIQDIYLDNFILRPIMNISTLSGEQIPTYKIPNLMYSDTQVLLDRYEIEQEKETNFTSLFLKDNILLGTSTGLEAINKNKNKSVSKFNVLESFTYNFEYSFLNAFKPTKEQPSGIHVLMGNYADKSTIMSKVISLGAVNKEGKYIIGSHTGENIATIEEVKELFRTQSLDFYTDILNNIFENYKKIGVKIDSNVDSNIKNINIFLKEFKDRSSFLKFVHEKAILDPTIEIVSELSYSIYLENKKPRLAMNQAIVDNYRIFKSKDRFNDFVKREEESLISKLKEELGSEDGVSFLFTEDKLFNIEKSINKDYSGEGSPVINHWLSSLGITKTNYKPFITEKGHKVSLNNNRINPLLERWMWVNNLFKHEYLALTVKMEYMHPAKKIAYRGDSLEVDVEALDNENSIRIPQMSKRNVSFTATYEIPTKHTREGTPDKVNIAVIEDYSSPLYNLSGATTNAKVHDGSSYISYVYSRMIESSYPGKSYKGTKKRIGTFIKESSSALKKDAETVITNWKIRSSNRSVIKFGLKQKQMLSAMNLPNFSRTLHKLPTSGIYYKDGEYFKINEYSINNGLMEVNLSKYNNLTKKFESLGKMPPQKINTLYDIWKIFGGEYSADLDKNGFTFTEGSNDLLFDLITSGNYFLKNNMIHIISNETSFKSGPTNVNPSSHWYDSKIEKLSYSTYKGSYLGPQLDANHDINESHIKEITQIISALSQNPKSAPIANEIYNDIARIIRESAKPYLSKITNLDNEKMESYYKTLSRNFAYALADSSNTGLAKTIAESFGQGSVLPFSHQSLFKDFTRDLITKMNNEFITRYYPGIGVLLNPSHGIIQVYEDPNGNIMSHNDIIKRAIQWYNDLPQKQPLSTEQIIDLYTEQTFPPQEITLAEVNLGDIIEIGGRIENLNDIELYYNIKFNSNLPLGTLVKKIYNVPRDLKPAEITFTYNGIKSNVFDLPSVKLRYALEKGESNINLDRLANYWGIARDNDFVKNMALKLNAWTQRNLDLLDDSLVIATVVDEQGNIIPEETFIPEDNLITTPFSEVKDIYIKSRAVPVTDYVFKPAELIMGNMYKNIFNTGEDSIDIIRNTVNDRGENIYFKNKLDNIYIEDNKEADFKLILSEGDKPVYIKYVKEYPAAIKENNSIFVPHYDDNTGELNTYRVSNNGTPLYKKLPESKIISHDGYDIVYIKIGKNIKVDAETKTLLSNNFSSDIREFLKSFKGKIKAIIPLMNGSNELTTNLVKNTKNGLVPSNSNEITFNIFKKFSGYNSKDNKLSKDWFKNNKEAIITQLGNKMLASWEKSLEVVSARIPAQSMQSFMEMKNISYFDTDTNDAFVSVWQIWLQGSDFK